MAAKTPDTRVSGDAAGGVDLHYGHPRMSLADRAKIFNPFDPLKGFREALREEELKAQRRHDPRGE